MASARPVSGEIMARSSAAAPPARDLSSSLDIIDADYEVLARASAAETDPVPPPVRAPVAPPPIEGMASLRPAGTGPPFSVRGSPLFWTAGLAAALAAFWISGGHALMRHPALSDAGQNVPSTLSITGVVSHVDASGEKPVLFVDGEAGNDGATTAVLPPLEIRVTGDDGGVTRYRLGTSGRALAPGQRFAFSSRLEVPRNGVRTVSVGFAE